MIGAIFHAIGLRSGSLDPLTVAYAAASGATDLAGIDKVIRYVRAESLLSNFVMYPMKSAQNAGTGPTAYGLGGLTTNEMQFINGVGWTEDGATFASASSQYGSIPDFLTSENLTIFHRATISDINAVGRLVTQWQATGNNRSFIFDYDSRTTSENLRFVSSDDGSSLSGPSSVAGGVIGNDTCFVVSTDNTSDQFDSWINNSSVATNGTALLPLYNTPVDILINASDPDSPTAFNDQTAHALAFLTGTVTTTQRETITDLINAL
jgi:hypothetical protein